MLTNCQHCGLAKLTSPFFIHITHFHAGRYLDTLYDRQNNVHPPGVHVGVPESVSVLPLVVQGALPMLLGSSDAERIWDKRWDILRGLYKTEADG